MVIQLVQQPNKNFVGWYFCKPMPALVKTLWYLIDGWPDLNGN
jgi:hypothetical protein